MSSAKLARFSRSLFPLNPPSLTKPLHGALRRSSLPGPTLHFGESDELTSLYSSILSGIRNNIAPEVHRDGGGVGGVYLLKDHAENTTAVFKPLDEESLPVESPLTGHVPLGKEIKPGLLYGEGYLKEIAAYVLDHEHFADVPPTVLFHCPQPLFEDSLFPAKTGSLQKYVNHLCTSEDMGWGAFPVDQVHKIGVLDCRLLNADRHMGNILVVKSGSSFRLVPIDHGMCLPSSLSCGYFEWLSFPQAKQPFSKETLAYIARLDPDAEIRTLIRYLPLLRRECLDTLKICTIFLKKAAKKGLTLYQIGCMMTRYHLDEDEPTDLEKIHARTEQRMRDRLEEKVKSPRVHSYDITFWEVLDDEINKALLSHK